MFDKFLNTPQYALHSNMHFNMHFDINTGGYRMKQRKQLFPSKSETLGLKNIEVRQL